MGCIFFGRLKYGMRFILLATAAGLLCGCAIDSAETNNPADDGGRRVITLKEISPQKAQSYLSSLRLGETSAAPEGNAVVVRGAASDLYRAGVLLDLVDTREEFCIEPLTSASNAASLPANSRTAEALGNIAIGTFADPPQPGERTRAIIDVHGSFVVAVIPVRVQKDFLAFLKSSVAVTPSQQTTATPAPQGISGETPGTEPPMPAPSHLDQSSETTQQQETPIGVSSAAAAGSSTEPNACSSAECPPVKETASQPPAKQTYDPIPLPNGDDVLQLDLPDEVELSQLLDLAAEYLHIDYMCEQEKIQGQTVSLRLHGKLQGDIRVKDLYPLLESVLKFKGFAMTRHKDNIVTIVPLADALQADPTLMDPNGTSLAAGDMVVTRVFELRHISPSSAMNLLDNMKVSVASSAIDETRSLIVTCYAHRMERIQRLIEMVDRPGRPKEFRYRELQHTTATALYKKVEMLALELQTSPLQIVPMNLRFPAQPAQMSVDSSSTEPLQVINNVPFNSGSDSASAGPRAVYLDADERTNRLLMVGLPEELATVEKIIDALDVAQQDLRAFKSYEIKHVDAEEVRKQLVDFDLIEDKKVTAAQVVADVNLDPAAAQAAAKPVKHGTADPADPLKPQASVLVASNTLLVNATSVQHVRIAHVIDYVDTETRQESIPYEIYFLENQNPEHMAEVLRQLLQESVEDKEGKIEKVVRRADEEIVIVPDQNTFSLIVYASRKNQEWVRKLIRTLDKRRPQVLIDATLVEIRKDDEFNYDLEMAAGLPDLTSTSGQTGQFMADKNTTVTDKLQSAGRSQFAEFQVKSGKGVGFYADEHIQALLTAVQSKNYGRVLAKPKVLVNDNEKGNIKTADTTYVVKKSSVPVTNGTAGTDSTLIETAVTYEPYEAGITLEITPHISDGDLLRLDVQLTRSDFTSTSDEKPPDQTSSNVGTVVTVPDGSTIILGGMLKLNQNKGGSKVPILGDLPLIGGLFRSIDNSDVQRMLYIFVRAQVIRPADMSENNLEDLKQISNENREAFEKHEQEFQDYQTWPGVKSKTVSPPRVLDAR
ncbi:MAG: secretin N-terminal domain-containing protein [Solirubrobacterales bacterium]